MIASPEPAPSPPPTVASGIELVDVVLAASPDDRLEKAWRTGDAVKAGEIIARRADGEILRAPKDGFVVFPDSHPSPGAELYYFGVESRRMDHVT